VKPQNIKGNLYRFEFVLDKFSSFTSTILASICAVTLVFWVFLFGAFIFSRKVFDTNWQFVEEFTTYWLVMMCFFPLAYTLRTQGHISIDIVIKHFPEKVKNILRIVTGFLGLAILCYLFWYSTDWFIYGIEANVHSRFISNVILWPFFLLIPVGLFFFILELILEIWRSIKLALRTGEQRLVNNSNKLKDQTWE
jgi:TRAP-type C4-dicarboxylate transport system permease small subunit